MAAASSFGQPTGYITLDNYNSNNFYGGPDVTYGLGVPADGVSGVLGTPGTGLNSSWTAGLYYAVGALSITDPAGPGIPNVALSLATGNGSTAQFASAITAGIPGEFKAVLGFLTTATGGGLITVEVVAYDTAGGTYANAAYRTHSDPFTMPTNLGYAPVPPLVGDYMHGFSVGIPEPSAFAVALSSSGTFGVTL